MITHGLFDFDLEAVLLNLKSDKKTVPNETYIFLKIWVFLTEVVVCTLKIEIGLDVSNPMKVH